MSKMGTPPRVPKAFQGSMGESRKRARASRPAVKLRKRDILLCSVSFFVCVKN